jgi:GIY-YIG catalytic domain
MTDFPPSLLEYQRRFADEGRLCIVSGDGALAGGVPLSGLRPRQGMEAGDQDLHLGSSWLQDKAFVAWAPCEQPWLVEQGLIEALSPPLNLDHNEDHPFFAKLSEVRRSCRAKARAQQSPPNAQPGAGEGRLLTSPPLSLVR